MGATIELQRQEEAEQWEQQYYQNRARELRQNRGQGYSERLIDDFQPDGVLNFLFRQRRPGAGQGQGPDQGDMEVEPSEQNIQLLVDMGFDRTRARDALRSSGDDLETATSLLLRQWTKVKPLTNVVLIDCKTHIPSPEKSISSNLMYKVLSTLTSFLPYNNFPYYRRYQFIWNEST